MIRRRVFWTLTALFIWFLSLVIIGYASKRTRVGYKIQQLKIKKEQLQEKNLRLQCEISAAYDLEKARSYALEKGYKHLEPSQLMIVTGEDTR